MEEIKDFYIGEDGLEYCCKCHTPREKELPSPFGDNKPFKVHFMCECQRKAYEIEQAERAKREFDEMVSRNRMVCFHTKRMYDWTFANDDGKNPAVAKAKAYVDAWDDMKSSGIGLMLWGGVGTGKTYLAAAIANELLDQGKRVLMRDFSEISNISIFDADEYVASLSSYDLVILDDLGAERKSEFALQNVFNVVNRRWESGKPMIVTTNLSIKEMKALSEKDELQYQRIYDRVFDMCTPICVNGASRRVESSDKKKAHLTDVITKEVSG